MASTVPGLGARVPGNGDLNPYGVAVVPKTAGHLVKGDVLVSNFNDAANKQGTGSTIVQVSPGGARRVFARLGGGAPGRVGLTTALATLPGGGGGVGNLPTTNGQPATAKAGGLIVLNSAGQRVETISGRPINGPWDLVAVTHGNKTVLFVTNILNGTVAAGGKTVDRGTVARIVLVTHGHAAPTVASTSVIASGLAERTDSAALVVGPTGLGLSRHGTLYIADSASNRITAVPGALTRATSAGVGTVVSSGGHLNDPLGLAIAPNGDILTVNGGDGNIVETTPADAQVAKTLLDTTGSPRGAGALFGLAAASSRAGVYFVDDNANTLDILGRA